MKKTHLKQVAYQEITDNFFHNCNSHIQSSQLSELEDSEMPKPFFQDDITTPSTEVNRSSKCFSNMTNHD